jgi:hypothetical protein
MILPKLLLSPLTLTAMTSSLEYAPLGVAHTSANEHDMTELLSTCAPSDRIAEIGDEVWKTKVPRPEKSSPSKHRFKGWRVSVATSAALATTTLLTNCAFTVWAFIRFGSTNGIGTLYEGNCDIVNGWSLWLHILINVLSSALLGASNYTMQILSAPTRSECDRAHADNDWVDIGIVSFRNLTRIGRKRSAAWILLALSSVPIHLLYNTAVFKTLDANSYTMVLTDASFQTANDSAELVFTNSSLVLSTKPPENHTMPLSNSTSSDYGDIWASALEVHDFYFKNVSSFVPLNQQDCIAAYGKSFVSGYSHVVVLASSDNRTDTQDQADLVLFGTAYSNAAGTNDIVMIHGNMTLTKYPFQSVTNTSATYSW